MIGGGSRGDAFCFPREHAGIIDRQFRAAIMDRQNNGGGNFGRIRHVIRGFPSASGSVRSLIDRPRFSGTVGSVRNGNDPFHSLRGSRLSNGCGEYLWRAHARRCDTHGDFGRGRQRWIKTLRGKERETIKNHSKRVCTPT